MKFDSDYLGQQAFGADDRVHPGAVYSLVKNAMFENAYYLKWGHDGEPPLPVYDVTLGRILRGFLPGGDAWKMKEAAIRTVHSKSLLRWGQQRRGFRRLLHPNGVCLFGRWIIDEETHYSGYFQSHSEGLVIGRYSTCCTECRRGHYRSLSLAGALFPTSDPNHPQPLPTASFITQEDLGGTSSQSIHDAVLRNAPNVTPWRRGFGIPILLLTGLAFKRADRQPTIRQLHEVAELDKPEEVETATPQFMQLTVASDPLDHENKRIDFRDEVLAQIYDPGDPTPRRMLTFNIQVSDEGRSHGFLSKRRVIQNWKTIGRIQFSEAVASYNGDFVLHMPHPKWR